MAEGLKRRRTAPVRQENVLDATLGESNLASHIWSAAAAFALLQYGQGLRSFGQVLAQGRRFWRPGLWTPPSVCGAIAPAAGEAWGLARRALEQTKKERALALLDKAVALEPDRADFLILRALVRLGGLLPLVFTRFPRFQELCRAPESDLQSALKLAPESVWAHLVYGLLEYVQRRFHAAEPHFARAAELAPRWAWPRILRADAVYYLRRIDLAVAGFHEAVKLDPDNAWAYALLGRAKNLTLDPSMNEDLDRSVALAPDAGWVYAWRGIALVAIKHDSAAALRDFDRAKELDRHYDRIYAWRASQLIKMGRPGEALPDLRKALKLNPHLDITHYSLGRAYFLLGRPREAVREIRRAVEGSHLSIWIYNWGDWNHQNHARRETLQDLDRAVGHSPRSAWAWAWRGQTRLSLSDHHGALSDLDKALGLAPGFAYAHAWRAEALRRLGRAGQARRALDRAIRLDPSCVWAHAWRGRLSLDAGRSRAAVADLSRALGMNRRLGLALMWRFQARLLGGDRRKALEDVVAAMEFHPTWKWLWIWRARLACGLGRRDEALAAIDEAVRLSPGPDGYGARAFLRWRAGEAHEEGALRDVRQALAQEPSSPLWRELARLVAADDAGGRRAPRFLEEPLRRLRRRLKGGGVWDLAADFSALEKNSAADESFGIRYDGFERGGSPGLRAAIASLRRARLAEALNGFDEVLRADPGDVGAMLLKADCLLKLEVPRFAQAESLAARCLELSPGQREAHLVRHQARKGLGDAAGALEDMKAARQDQDPRVALEAARLLRGLGRHGEALLAAEGLLELDPFDQGAARLRAEVLIAAGRSREALAELRKLLALMPGLTWPWVTVSQARFRAGRSREALAAIDRALLGSAAFSYAAHAWRAVYLGALRRDSEMRESLERALTLNPHCGWLRLARDWPSLNGADSAGRFELALRLDPNFSEALAPAGRP